MILATILLLIAQGPNGGVTPQQQIDLAPPGAVLRITARGESITIRKPLTILGDYGAAPLHDRLQHITLDGPGSGNVTLVGLDVQGSIKGGGFSEVRFDRVFFAPEGVNLGGIDYLELANCHFSSFVLAPDSQIVSAATTWSGFDVPQVEARELYCYGGQPYVVQAPVYEAAEADVWVLSQTRPGDPLDIGWFTPGPYGFLYVNMSGSSRPTPQPGANFGRNHLGGWPSIQLLAVDRCSRKTPATYRMDMPQDWSLLGRQLAFQVYDPPGYYSAPAFVTIR